MRAIPPKLKGEILELKQNHVCARSDENECEGRLTLEHAWIYAGKQINELWAIIAICAKHHEVDNFQDSGHMDKNLNQLLSLERARMLYGPDWIEELNINYDRKDWKWEYESLLNKCNQNG